MLVSDLMSSPVHGAFPYDTVSHARNLMIRHRISRILVLDDGQATGIITKKDIGFRLRRKEPEWRFRKIDHELLCEVMSSDLVCVSPDSGVRDALMIMMTHKISGVPVVDQGMVRGMFTRTDLLRSTIVQSLDLPVRDIMHDPVQVTPGHSSVHVVDLIRNGAGAVVVADDSGLAGIITETDLAFYEEQPDAVGSGTAAGMMRSSVPSLPYTARTGEAVALMQKNACQSVIITGETGIVGIITRDDIIREVAL